MTRQEREVLKEKIARKIAKLHKDVEELSELTRPIGPDNAIGRVSRMDAINNRSINEAALRKKRLQLNKLTEALKSIDQPDFGVCIKCGAAIQPERIMLMPESKVCISCAR